MEHSQRTRVRTGDHDEFGALFTEHARAVYNHAFRLTGNWSAAEEVVSLTFLEAWRLRGTLRPEGGSLLPWLLGIALNVSRNVSRAARRHQAAMGRLPQARSVPDFADELAGHKSRARRRTAALVGLATAAIAGAALAVVMTAGGAPPKTSTTLTPSIPHTAAQLLAKIADAAASQPAPVVKDSEFAYIRSMDAYSVSTDDNRPSTMEPLHERQIWLPVADICVTGLLIENGERTPISPFPVSSDGKVVKNSGLPLNFTCPSEGHLGDASYRLLQSIPTEPQALLAYLEAGKKWTNDDPPTEIGDLIREAIVPPRLAAALYRLAATLPGATLVPHATTGTGQPGIGIMWTGKSAKQVYQNEWIFDPKTLQFIGEKTFDPTTGKLNGESTIVQRAFVAKAGQVPS